MRVVVNGDTIVTIADPDNCSHLSVDAVDRDIDVTAAALLADGLIVRADSDVCWLDTAVLHDRAIRGQVNTNWNARFEAMLGYAATKGWLDETGALVRAHIDRTGLPIAPSPVTPQVMRSVLGQFCSGITIITAMGPAGPVGFTCQSFSSLSLDPPMVSFSPARTSTSWPVVREAGTYVVNILSQNHPRLSDAFARSGTDKFADVAWTPSPSGAPVLDGVLAWAECSTWAEYDGGDHTIVAASVSHLEAGPEQVPLVYLRGAYHATRPLDDARS